jgi:SAM-dependent methyltransferase
VVRSCLEQVLAAPLPEDMERELVIVDDCSQDGTAAILAELASENPCIRLLRHEVNQGKGAAIRTAIEQADGDFALIQDADLEYDPSEYPRLLRPLLDGRADAVFGSRYLAGTQRRVLPFWHSRINGFLTLASNLFSNADLTDMETCYKVYRTDLLKSIPIRSNRFGIEPELAMKSAKRRLRIYEVPISYHGRTYEEGKKIGWRDGLNALTVILKYWLIDDLYAQPYGRAFLNNMSGTPQYVNWIVELLRPHMGECVLEINAGIGSFSGLLLGRRTRYVATERDPLYLHALRNRFLRTPNVHVRNLDPNNPVAIVDLDESFETILLINVLEYLDDPVRTLAALKDRLSAGGRMLILVPNNPNLAGAIDERLGIRRRYRADELRAELMKIGLTVECLITFNRAGAPFWWFFGRVLGKNLSKITLKMFDKTVWIWKAIDGAIPWGGVSLIAVARKEV